MKTYHAARYLAVVFGLLVCAGTHAPAADPKPALPDPSAPHVRPGAIRDGLELAFSDSGELRRLSLKIVLDGKPLADAWQEVFGRVFAFFDTSKDGALDTLEAERLPAAFELRQLLWGATALGRSPPRWEELDQDASGRVSPAELADYYRRAGLGNALVAAGVLSKRDALTSRILEHLDFDADGAIGDSEWTSFAARLAPLDANGDELISPVELAADAEGRWWFGASLVAPPALLSPPPAEAAAAHTASRESTGAESGDAESTGAESTGAESEAVPRVENPPAASESLPFVVLPQRLADSNWTQALLIRLDGDNSGDLSAAECRLDQAAFRRLDVNSDDRLAVDELRAWRDLAPNCQAGVQFGEALGEPRLEATWAKAAHTADAAHIADAAETADAAHIADGWLRFTAGRTRVFLRTAVGDRPSIASVGKTLLSRFAECDQNQDGQIDSAEASNRESAAIVQLAGVADQNGDGRLSRDELAAWLDLQSAVANCHCLVTVIDCGFGLFGVLDSNHDGALSNRELRSAKSGLANSGCLANGTLDAVQLPRTLVGVVSRGRLPSDLPPPATSAPVWFSSMDRNSDGDITRREFVGPSARFSLLDADGDGAISAAEAAAARAER